MLIGQLGWEITDLVRGLKHFAAMLFVSLLIKYHQKVAPFTNPFFSQLLIHRFDSRLHTVSQIHTRFRHYIWLSRTLAYKEHSNACMSYPISEMLPDSVENDRQRQRQLSYDTTQLTDCK